MTKVAIRGAQLIDPERSPRDDAGAATLLLDAGRIVGRVGERESLGGDWRREERAGLSIAPGFIDLHFHGELIAASPGDFAAALERAADRMPSEGTSAFLATTLCWPREEMAGHVAALAEAAAQGASQGAACLGLHLEGPWISPDAPGAMQSAAIRPFDGEREVLERAGEALRMVTLAPELPGADALLDELAAREVVAALGHSRARPADIDAAIARGLRHVTHLWNAMGGLHHRDPGVPGAVIADERLTCDLICDGHHVDPAVVRLSARALGERMMLITDRIEVSPLAPSALGALVPGEDGAPYRREDGTLAGSQLGLDRALRNVRRFAGLELADAVASATLRPARLLGIEAERGTLREGARADLALLDAEGRVVETWIDGSAVWRADPDRRQRSLSS